MYAALNAKPATPNASTGQPRATKSTSMMARSIRLTTSAAPASPPRLIIPDSTG